MLLGDAALALDPITGAGMAQALLSAELLARCLARRHLFDGPTSFDASDDVLAEFDRRRRVIYRDATWLTRMLLLLVRQPRLARGALAVLRPQPAAVHPPVRGGRRHPPPAGALIGPQPPG